MIDWGNKLKHFQQVLLQEISQLTGDLKQSQGATQLRLQALHQGKQQFLLEITKLLQPLLNSPVTESAIYGALRDRAPSVQNLLSYEANIYRDWVWGKEENQLSFDLVSSVAPKSMGKLCVLGAGACRLALDLHQHRQSDLTVATDINPLFLLAVQQLMYGNNLHLTEFPLHPKTSDDVVLSHTLKALQKKPEHFYLCFADVAKPAFVKAAFDTVLTPWLIDIQPFELARFLRQLNYYLPVGGTWLNFGSLVFSQQRDRLCYSMDEVRDIAKHAGFDVEQTEQHELPYLKSPYNAGYRMETVWVWRAIKVRDVEVESNPQVLPPWLLDLEQPVPLSAEHKQLSAQHVFLADVFARVDGRVSIRQMARKLSQQQDLNAEDLEALIRNYFLRFQR